jgi:hypothetical protein
LLAKAVLLVATTPKLYAQKAMAEYQCGMHSEAHADAQQALQQRDQLSPDMIKQIKDY